MMRLAKPHIYRRGGQWYIGWPNGERSRCTSARTACRVAASPWVRGWFGCEALAPRPRGWGGWLAVAGA